VQVLEERTTDPILSLKPFPNELRWQMAVSLLLILVLGFTFVVVILIFRGLVRSQRSLRELSRQAADILESMGQGVLTADTDGNLFMMNREAQRILRSKFPEHDRHYSALDKRTGLRLEFLERLLLKNQDPVDDQQMNFEMNGHPVHLLVSGHLLRDEHGAILGTVLHLKDVTERHFTEQRIQLMEGYMGLGPVAAGLQHEIKNPLGALSLHVQLLGEHLSGNTDNHVKQELHILRSEIRRIGQVLETFDDYAKAHFLNQKDQSIPRLIEKAIELLKPQADEKRIQFRKEWPGEDIIGCVDADKLSQVLINLLLNALEVMDDSGEITIKLSMAGQRLIIEILDQGPGVSEAIADSIFAPYFSTKKSGLGMGLAVCRKIVREHKGDLTCSNHAAGAKFKIELPAVEYGNK
jgi:signal transduction histidine kinase